MSQQQKHCHHNVPISLLGSNYVENMIMLTPKEHDIVHSTLDISAKVIRSFRLKTNHLSLRPNEYYITELQKLQKLYFARQYVLPEHIQQLSAQSMFAYTTRMRLENGLEPLTGPHKFASWDDMFKHWLSIYHESMFLIIKKP